MNLSSIVKQYENKLNKLTEEEIGEMQRDFDSTDNSAYDLPDEIEYIVGFEEGERMRESDKKVLMELTKEQLIYLIEQFHHSQFLISETCVEESKWHIDSREAVCHIRDCIYDMPSLYDANEVSAYIDMKMEKISVEEYRKRIGLE